VPEESFVEKNGSKILGNISFGIPIPESLTSILTYCPGSIIFEVFGL
jgi:hypothetical protein